MSSGGQIAGGIIGAVIGFYAGGGPQGAYYGAMIGAGIGGYLDPPKGPTVEGPRLNDLSVQSSTYGSIVQRIYGVIAVYGNLLWLENNKLKETVKKKKQGGKGVGSSSTLKTYTYSATFALGLCEGPIVGVRRIWCGDKLIYNAGSDVLETIIASNRVAAGFKLYLGTDDQLPDARYEANVGLGNAPAFRGLAYIVFYDFDLSDYGNTLQAAQFKVEVVGAGAATESVYVDGGLPQVLQYEYSVFGMFSDDALVQAGTANDRWYNDPDYKSWIVSLSGSVSYGSYISTVRTTAFSSKYKNSRGPLFIPSPYFGGCQYDGVFYPYSGDVLEWAEIPGGLIVLGGDNVIRILSTGGVVSSVSVVGFRDFYLLDNVVYLVKTGVTRLLNSADLSLIDERSNSLVIDTYTTLGGGDGNIYLSRGVHSYEGYESISLLDDSKTTILHTYSLPVFSGDTVPRSAAAFCVSDGVILRACGESGGFLRWDVHKLYGVGIDTLPVSSVIESEVESTRLLSAVDIDTSLISSSMAGYKISGGSIRSAIEPLQGAFPFDIRQHGYVLQCIPRGQAPVLSINEEEFVSDGDQSSIVETSREMDSQLPAKTVIKYIDADREYAVSEQNSERTNTISVNRVDRDLPIVMSANKAAQVAEILEYLPWLERSDFRFKLPPYAIGVEPSDVITARLKNGQHEIRITETNELSDGVIECRGKPNRASLWDSNAVGGEAPGPDGQIGLSGNSLCVLLDIPVVDETVQNETGFVAVMTGRLSGWAGGVLYRSFDLGQTWDDLQAFPSKCTIGTARDKLSASSCCLIDSGSLQVDMISGELESISRESMLLGNHYVAYGKDGRWEIVRYQTAALQVDGSYLVSGFVRGEFGTEWASSLHEKNDYFVVLDDPDNKFISMSSSTIGAPSLYRAISNGADILSGTDTSFTYLGVNLECLSPVYARGSRDGSGNFTGSFTRRSRVSGTWWATGTPSPVGESAESYEIDVMSGATVKRTIASTSESFSYSAANQVTDFGSAQSAITFRIYQMSAVVGRGYPLEVTL